MKLTKTQWIIVAVVAGVAIWYFLIRKKKMESSYDDNLMIFGNESGYDMDNLDESLPLIGNESGYQEGDACTCTTCESTPTNPNQAPTVWAGPCTPNLANQPYAGYHTVTQSCPCKSSTSYVRGIRTMKNAVKESGFGLTPPKSPTRPSIPNGTENNWWGSDWVRDMTKELNRKR